MSDHLDVPLEDPVLLEEVELISTLIIAASETEGHLEQDHIDRLLGVEGPVVPEQHQPDSIQGGPAGDPPPAM